MKHLGGKLENVGVGKHLGNRWKKLEKFEKMEIQVAKSLRKWGHHFFNC